MLDIAEHFPNAWLYHTGAARYPLPINCVDVSQKNLHYLSALSELCDVLVCRLSAAMVVSFTAHNHGRPRIVWGEPLGCPIWDDVGVQYTRTVDELFAFIDEGLKNPWTSTTTTS